jgi:hypothetical protein
MSIATIGDWKYSLVCALISQPKNSRPRFTPNAMALDTAL